MDHKYKHMLAFNNLNIYQLDMDQRYNKNHHKDNDFLCMIYKYIYLNMFCKDFDKEYIYFIQLINNVYRDNFVCINH